MSCLEWSALRVDKRFIMPFTKSDKTIPISTTVVLDTLLSIADVSINAMTTVARPNTKPAKGSMNPDKTGIDISRISTSAAPRDAPEETPRV